MESLPSPAWHKQVKWAEAQLECFRLPAHTGSLLELVKCPHSIGRF